jgi:peptidoglycan/LPS O-acetylase OafA/YrhL
MLNLDRSKNDTSLALDLLRAIAAQMVCIGHAWNNADLPPHHTSLPDVGVVLFFILSGFVIAYTLETKSAGAAPYNIGRYGIERFSRIYCAYLPAMVLLAAIEYGLRRYGIEPNGSGPVSFTNFILNLAMLQRYPGYYSGQQFGMSGQMISVVLEFHIYFFVGALYFLCIGRQRIVAAIVAVLSARMPLIYFDASGSAAHDLFILWLAGFAMYFAMRAVQINAGFVATFGLAVAVICFLQPFDSDHAYDLGGFPALIFCFALLVAVTQQSRILVHAPWVGKAIHFFAGYSLTLFLVHVVLVRTIYLVWGKQSWGTFAVAVIGSNLFAAAFAQVTEAKYKRVAEWLVGIVARKPADDSPLVSFRKSTTV